MASRGAIRSGLGSIANAIMAKRKHQLEATEKARQENLRLQVFQNNPELLGGPLRQPIPPARFNRDRPFPPPGVIEETNVGPPLPRPGARQEIQARLQGIQQRQQENFKEFAIDNEENAKIFSQLPADVSAKLATELRTGRTDSFARIKEQAGSFGSVAQQALSMKAGPRRNDFLIKDFETRQRLAESEGVQGPDPQRYLDIINATGNPDMQNSLLKNVVGTSRDIEKLITSKETQDKDQLERDDFALSDVFKSAANMETIPREGQLSQQDFFLQNQRQTFIAEGNNRGVQEIDRMLRVPAGPNRTLLMTSRGQQIEGKEVRKARFKSEANFEFVVDEKGNKIAQRNMLTGEIKKLPASFGAAGGKGEKATFAKSPGVIFQLVDGTFAQAIPVLDTRTGKVVNKISPIPGQPVSRIGETGEELTARKIKQAGGITRTKAQQTRLQTDIDDGISAAKGFAIVNRSLGLLNSVKTGGIDAAILRAKQLFGVESANEAELSANLGKRILAQLRPIFGAQFTEREGATLARIEAGFGKSVKGNIRLLNQAKQLIQRAAKRGIAAAVETEDFRTAQDIKDLLEFTLEGKAPLTQIETPAQIKTPVATTTTPKGIPAPPPGFVVQ